MWVESLLPLVKLFLGDELDTFLPLIPCLLIAFFPAPSFPLCFSKSYTFLETQLVSSMEPVCWPPNHYGTELLWVPITLTWEQSWGPGFHADFLYMPCLLSKIMNSLKSRVMSLNRWQHCLNTGNKCWITDRQPH